MQRAEMILKRAHTYPLVIWMVQSHLKYVPRSWNVFRNFHKSKCLKMYPKKSALSIILNVPVRCAYAWYETIFETLCTQITWQTLFLLPFVLKSPVIQALWKTFLNVPKKCPMDNFECACEMCKYLLWDYHLVVSPKCP